MPRKIKISYIAAAAYVVIFLCCACTAIGTPQFARKTGLHCSSCHTHVPLLNEFGQKFYANGFRLPKAHKDIPTIPAWGSIGATASISRDLNGATPIDWGTTEIASYETIELTKTLYHFEYTPSEKDTVLYAIQPIGSRFAVQLGNIGLLSQYDPGLDLTQSTPIYLGPVNTSSGDLDPFSPAASVYGVRVTASLSGNGALPYADGWKIAAAAPFSVETDQPQLDAHAEGMFLEAFRREGMDSYGVNYFAGRDGRHYYGTVEQKKFGKFFLEGGASYATFDGTDTRSVSLGVTWSPVWDKALAFRIDNQDGQLQYIPTASLLLGGKTGTLMLVAETISMARSTDPNTNGSQFFVCLSRAGTQHLDHRYASFGELVRGKEVVLATAQTPVGKDDHPTQPPVIRRIYLVDAMPLSNH